MNTLNEITTAIFNEFNNIGLKPVSLHTEGNVLVIKIGNADTRILNWEFMSVSSIIDIARGLTLQENYKGNVLLHG